MGITFLRDVIQAFRTVRAQRKAAAQALRNAEHAAAIQDEHGRHYGNVCQQIADEINELQTGKVTAFTRRRAAKARG